MNRLVPWCGTSAILAGIALCAGCTPPAPQAKLSGTVKLHNKPLPGGSVVFLSNDGKVDRATIKPDGTYESTTVPIGPLKVAIEPAAKGVGGNMPKGAKKIDVPTDSPAAQVYGKSSGEYVPIPFQYQNPDTSNLTVTVVAGENPPYNIDIGSKGSK